MTSPQSPPRPLFPSVTWILGIGMVGVFAAMLVRGVSVADSSVHDILSWGASHGPRSLGNQPWRLLTATFLHSDLLHLLANLGCLLLGGIVLERILGHGRFTVLFLLSALAASATSVLVHPDVVSLGASGAVFGMFGGLLALLRPRRGSVAHPAMRGLGRAVLVLVTAQLLYGLWSPDIDNAAHLGGWLTGFLLVHCAGLEPAAGTQGPPHMVLPRWRRSLALAAGSTLIVTALAWARVQQYPHPDSVLLWEQAESLRLEQRWSEAEHCYDLLVSIPRSDPAAVLGRGICRLELGRLDEAREDLEQAVEQLPNDSWAWFHLGMVRARTGRYQEALASLDESLSLTDSSATYLLRGWVREQLGRLVEARRDYSLAQEFDPDSADAFYEEGLLLCTWHGPRPPDVQEAERVTRRALELDEEDPELWVLLALVHLREGDPAAAAEALEEAQRRDSARSTLHQILRALTLHALGQKADARQEWQAVNVEEAGFDRAMESLLFEAQGLFPGQDVIR